MITRALSLPRRPPGSFFLWGPRQTGKTTLLKASYPRARWVDLLKTDEYIRYTQIPSLLREEIAAGSPRQLVIIDEVQKVPALLNEVHWMMENWKTPFGLCGSSARKARRGQVNLLGGRAVRHQLFGLVSAELGKEFVLTRMLNHGYLPRHYLSDAPRQLLMAYVNDYLKEEIAAEGIVRNLPAFAGFLSAAALSDAEMVNYTTIARDCGVSSPAIKEYFQILVDTLLGRYLPAYTARPKRRVIQAPKFYFADVGVVNSLARRGEIQPGSELYGKAFENWVFHELSAYNAYRQLDHEFSYWRLASGAEVDFVVDDCQVAIEAKSTRMIHDGHLKGLRELAKDKPRAKRRIVVSLDPKQRKTADSIEVLPAMEFAKQLWAGVLL